MSEFVWRMPENAPIQSEGALTYQLLIPKASYGVHPKRLPNSIIWVIRESSKTPLLYAKLSVISIEIIKTGPLAGFLILDADIDRSFYLAPRNPKESDLWNTWPENISGLPINLIIEADRALSKKLADIVTNSIERRFAPPEKSLLQDNERDLKAGSPRMLVQSTVRSLKRLYAIGDLPFYARHKPLWTVYESVTYFVLKKAGLAQKEIIEALDWYVNRRSKINVATSPQVDTILRGVDPEAVVPREFTATGKTPDQETFISQLAKLDYAEKKHQAILRDLVCNCLSMGVSPLDSRSIDLALKVRDGRLHLLEIKSASPKNFFDQATKAVVQLLHYRYEMEQAGERIAGISVVIESCDNDELRTYTTGFLESLGVDVFIYSDNLPWPQRVPQLERLLGQAT